MENDPINCIAVRALWILLPNESVLASRYVLLRKCVLSSLNQLNQRKFPTVERLFSKLSSSKDLEKQIIPGDLEFDKLFRKARLDRRTQTNTEGNVLR